MNTKHICIISLFISSVAYGQAPGVHVKLTKTEKIWIAAYDDTTKALASLFLSKRNQHRKEKETGYVVLGASVAVLGTGLLLSSRNTDTSGSTVDQDMDMSFVPLLLGFSGIIYSGIALGGHAITMHPYTIKKYNRLLTQYEAGEPIPKFYKKRMAKYLY